MAEKPWHEAYPQPRNTSPNHITREDLLSRLQTGQEAGRDLLLIDLRRNDHEVSSLIRSPGYRYTD